MRAIMRLLLVSVCAVGWSAGEPAQPGAAGRRRDASVAYSSAFAREYEPYVFAAVPLHAPVPVLHVLSPAPLGVPPLPRAANPPRARTPIRVTPYTRPYEGPYSDTGAYDDPRAYVEHRPYPEVRPYKSRPYVETLHYGNSRPYVDAVEFEESAPSPLVRTVARPREVAAESDLDSYAVQVYPRVSFPQPAAASFEDYSSQEAAAAPTVLYAKPSLSGGYTYRKVANKKPPPQKTSASKEQPVFVKIHKHKIIKS